MASTHFSDDFDLPTAPIPEELKDWQEKLLLEDIEGTEEPVCDFDFIKHANNQQRLYGLPGTELRELFRYRVKYLKRLPIDRYIRWLKKFDVKPSKSTQNLLLEETTDRLLGLSINEEAPATPPQTETPSPQKEKATSSPTPSNDPSVETMSFMSPRRSGKGESPFHSPSFSSPSATVQGASSFQNQSRYICEWNEPPQGTLDDPFHIHVCMSRPENNGIFDIAWIPQKIVHGYARNVVCVRVDAVPGDQNKYQMTVPSGSVNQLLVRTPSRSLHYSREEKFHRDGYCQASFNMHTLVSKAIEDDPTRAWVYYLLQFPPTVCLDNSVLSQDIQVVKKRKVGVKYDDKETGISGITSNAMIVCWEVAERAAGTRVGVLGEDVEDDAAAFG